MLKLIARRLIVVPALITSLNCYSQQAIKPEKISNKTILIDKKMAVQKKNCTDLPVSEWLSEEEFLVLMRHRGYKDFKFKIVYQSCYEIYGYDAKNRLIEAYFNPTNARLNRSTTVNAN